MTDIMYAVIGLFEAVESLCEKRTKKSTWQKFYEKLGIDEPEFVQPDHKHKSIGYSKNKKGYCGWSHRAYSCFPPGYTPKGDLVDKEFRGKEIKNLEQSREVAKRYAREVS